MRDRGVKALVRAVHDRVIPGHIYVVPALAELDHVPAVVHVGARDDDAGDAQLVEDELVGVGVALAGGLVVDQSAVGVELALAVTEVIRACAHEVVVGGLCLLCVAHGVVNPAEGIDECGGELCALGTDRAFLERVVRADARHLCAFARVEEGVGPEEARVGHEGLDCRGDVVESEPVASGVDSALTCSDALFEQCVGRVDAACLRLTKRGHRQQRYRHKRRRCQQEEPREMPHGRRHSPIDVDGRCLHHSGSQSAGAEQPGSAPPRRRQTRRQ